MPKKDKYLLAGDIGGTKAKLAIYHPKDGPRHPLAEATLQSADFASLEALVAQFLTGKGGSICRASLGIAGPIVNGRVQVTNLPWLVDERTLRADLGAPVAILNDLAAIALGIPFLEAQDLATLNKGTPAPNGAIAVIAPGTGAWGGLPDLEWRCLRSLRLRRRPHRFRTNQPDRIGIAFLLDVSP
ncbi:MAG: glucokinase [Anaerolineales bacterium]|nr:glucokinase [Anaerolineales bacterium]